MQNSGHCLRFHTQIQVESRVLNLHPTPTLPLLCDHSDHTTCLQNSTGNLKTGSIAQNIQGDKDEGFYKQATSSYQELFLSVELDIRCLNRCVGLTAQFPERGEYSLQNGCLPWLPAGWVTIYLFPFVLCFLITLWSVSASQYSV